MPWPISPAPMTASRIPAALSREERPPLKTSRRMIGPMNDIVAAILLFGAICASIIGPFVVVPEILERMGLNPRSGVVRGLVWTTFLLILFVPATLSGFVFTVRNPVDWVIFAVAMTVAILYDYYRLNPQKVPWVRARA